MSRVFGFIAYLKEYQYICNRAESHVPKSGAWLSLFVIMDRLLTQILVGGFDYSGKAKEKDGGGRHLMIFQIVVSGFHALCESVAKQTSKTPRQYSDYSNEPTILTNTNQRNYE